MPAGIKLGGADEATVSTGLEVLRKLRKNRAADGAHLRIRDLFAKYDKDGSGNIDQHEFSLLLGEFDLSPQGE
jgi:Ca2+-binding EF-hand superfamily protein